MTFTANLHRPLTLISASGGVDDDGNPAGAASATVYGYLEQTARDDRPETDSRHVAVESALLVLPAGTDLTDLIRIVDDDVVWLLDGPPWSVRRPSTNDEHHLEARLRRAH